MSKPSQYSHLCCDSEAILGSRVQGKSWRTSGIGQVTGCTRGAVGGSLQLGRTSLADSWASALWLRRWRWG